MSRVVPGRGALALVHGHVGGLGDNNDIGNKGLLVEMGMGIVAVDGTGNSLLGKSHSGKSNESLGKHLAVWQGVKRDMGW